jgi:hypothetical protein
MKARSLLVLAMLAPLSAACSGSADGSGERSAGFGEALVSGGAHADSDDANANVVVQLYYDDTYMRASCTGVLVSGGALLTSNHCITGDTSKGAPPWGSKPPVRVNSSASSLGTEVATTGAALRLNRPIDSSSPDDRANDVAVVFIDTDALIAKLRAQLDVNAMTNTNPAYVLVNNSEWGALVAARVTHPSFAPNPSLPTFGVGFTMYQQFRMIAPYSVGLGWEDGDSGGSIFALRADGSRDTFMLHEGMLNGNQSVETDLRTPTISGWLRSNLVDTTRGANWLAKHPLPAGSDAWWVGDVEYSGPCQRGDADCDHWYDAHDNCWYVFNPDQRDSNDDGTGDACVPPPSPSCSFQASCGGRVSLSCGAPKEGGIWMQRFDGTSFRNVGMTVANDWSGVAIVDDPPTGVSATYRVCAGPNESTCYAPVTVYLNETTCGSPPATGCGATCGTTNGGAPTPHPGHAM